MRTQRGWFLGLGGSALPNAGSAKTTPLVYLYEFKSNTIILKLVGLTLHQ